MAESLVEYPYKCVCNSSHLVPNFLVSSSRSSMLRHQFCSFRIQCVSTSCQENTGIPPSSSPKKQIAPFYGAYPTMNHCVEWTTPSVNIGWMYLILSQVDQLFHEYQTIDQGALSAQTVARVALHPSNCSESHWVHGLSPCETSQRSQLPVSKLSAPSGCSYSPGWSVCPSTARKLQ
jgi:hypothetical protein